MSATEYLKMHLTRRLLLGAFATGLLAACGWGGDDDDEPSEIPAAPASTATPPAPPPKATPAPSTPPESTATATPAATRDATIPSPRTQRVFRIASPIGVYSLNPHLAPPVSIWPASRLVLEPLFDFDTGLQPVLALGAQWPAFDNGLLDPGGRWVTWRLRRGVKWHDGEDFDAEDVAFTWEFIRQFSGLDSITAIYGLIERIDVLDPHTVQLHFPEPNPGWVDLFRGAGGAIVPEHIFRPFLNEPSRLTYQAVQNREIVGTGPWRVAEIEPVSDVTTGYARFERFDDYWDQGKPYFDVVEIEGGGDAASVARRVLQTGEADCALYLEWLDPESLDDLVQASDVAQIVQFPTNGVETLFLNFADPDTELGGARAEPETAHPLFGDRRVREAIALAVDRAELAGLWGMTAQPAWHLLPGPDGLQGPEFPDHDLERAAALLKEAGVAGGSLLYQTSVNSIRQDTQLVIKSQLEGLGFTIEVRAIDAGRFFESPVVSDPEHTDTYKHFYADMQMFTPGEPGPYPLDWARSYHSDEIASLVNAWTGENFSRYANPAYDALWNEAAREVDPARQAELWRGMMTILTEDFVAIPLLRRTILAGVSNRVTGWSFSPWAENPTWNLKEWRLADD